MIYLDNAATTAVNKECIKIVNEILTDCFANPSSLYNMGFESAKLLQSARLQVAKALGTALSVQSPEIIFTASGSEANNLAVLGSARARKAWGRQIVTTGYEHPSVQNAVAALENEGFEIIKINPDKNGIVDEAAIINAVNKSTALVCAMHINNETGAVLNVQHIASEVKKINSRTAVHVDGVQGFGKTSFSLAGSSIDTYSVSGHKLNAPKGVGALYIRKGFNIAKVIFGGEQERGLRCGTENLAFAAALGCAAEKSQENLAEKITYINSLCAELWQQLALLDGITRNSPQNACGGIVNFSIKGVKSQPMLNALDTKGICVSSGSACSKGAASHTLAAMGLDASRIDSAIRVSFSSQNTRDDVAAFVSALKEIIPNMAKTTR